MPEATNVPTRFPRAPLGADGKPGCRAIIPPSPLGWTEPVIHE